MTPKRVITELEAAGALLEGHFLLSSGLHSRQYVQVARVMMNPKRAARLCRALAQKVRETIKGDIDAVVAPAMGGVLVGYEMARQLGTEAMFVERESGRFALRRGFRLAPKARVLMVEDVITSGLSSREAITAIRENGGRVIGGACLIDRSGGRAKIGVKLVALAKLDIETFDARHIPEDLADIPAVKPGSRAMPKK